MTGHEVKSTSLVKHTDLDIDIADSHNAACPNKWKASQLLQLLVHTDTLAITLTSDLRCDSRDSTWRNDA